VQEEISDSLNIVRVKLSKWFKFQDLLDGKDDKRVYRHTNANHYHFDSLYHWLHNGCDYSRT